MITRTGQRVLLVEENTVSSMQDDVINQIPATNKLLVEIRYSGVNQADVRHAQLLEVRLTVLTRPQGAAHEPFRGYVIIDGDVISFVT